MANTLKKNNKNNDLIFQKLKESEGHYRDILNNADDLISVYNEKLNCEYINENALKRILGYTIDEVIGENSLKLIHPSDYKKAKNNFFLCFTNGESSGESRVKCKDGSYKWLQSKGKFFTRDGEKKLVLISRDITEIKETEKKFHEAEEKYQLIVKNTNDLIAILNDKFEHEFINQNAYLKVLGYTEDEIIGKRPRDLTHPDDIKRVANAIKRGLLKGETKDEFRIKHKDGHFVWLETTGKFFKDKDENVKAIFISRDITERKMMESKLKDQNVELEKLNELKSEFLRRATHELKTPLTAIKGYTDLLLELCNKQSNSEIKLNLENIHEGCNRLEHIIKNIIESSKLKSSQVELKTTKENLSILIKSSIQELKELSDSRNHSIELNIEENLFFNIDKEQIYEVITNLLRNAIIYTPPNGIIAIQTKVKNNSAITSIKDTGVGFTKKEKTQIFQQFGKINHNDLDLKLGIEGSGLGLYISKQIIEMHGGEIWVESEGRNKGSTFYFSLPRKRK